MAGWGVLVAGLCLLTPGAGSDQLDRAAVAPYVCAVLHAPDLLFFECFPSDSVDRRAFFATIVSADDLGKFENRSSVAIRAEQVRPDMRRRGLLALFPRDYVDAQGWWHTVTEGGESGRKLARSFCRWVTGDGKNLDKALSDKRNKGASLAPGAKILIPGRLLLLEMQEIAAPQAAQQPPPPQPAAAAPETPQQAQPVQPETPAPAETAATPASNAEERPPDLETYANELTYGKDGEGEYAQYRLKPGEALYSAVVVRFTDYRDDNAIVAASETIRKRSGIANVNRIPDGQKVKIPVAMLSDRYQPKESESRQDFEKSLQAAKKLRREHVKSRDLDGVVVVIDPGHGGRDHGAELSGLGLFENEINYDVACRVKNILETKTRAKVYMTMRDPKLGYKPRDCHRFKCSGTEEVLTTPHYRNNDAKVSVILRWHLANAIYRKELANGVDPRKMVFTSFHTDKLFNSALRGALVYIPGARYRNDIEKTSRDECSRFLEVRQQPEARTTAEERRRDEAMSRNFAENLMDSLGERRIRRHTEGDWIRNKIFQDGGKVYVPGVLRNTLIPTKVLIEMANMTNESDQQRLADPEWRQAFAEAYVLALRKYYGGN